MSARREQGRRGGDIKTNLAAMRQKPRMAADLRAPLPLAGSQAGGASVGCN